MATSVVRWITRQWQSPNTLVALLLLLWWLVNILQGAYTELANDEAYYWSWIYCGESLDWGYFDHPPMVAWLIWLTSWMGGTLGVRFAATLLQPLYLWIFWRVVCPEKPSQRDALLFVGLCAAMPALQAYGWLALPDAPLMMFTVTTLWAFHRFRRNDTTPNALLLAVSVALLLYSKYHGVLVVLFLLLSDLSLLRRWLLYLAAAVALLLWSPYLGWLASHDWCTLRFHLLQRHHGFEATSLILVVVNFVMINNPLLTWHGLQAILYRSDETYYRRSLKWLAAGFFIFFLVAALFGSTQAQWLLPATIGIVGLLFDFLRNHDSSRRYATWAIGISIILLLIMRILLVVNPFNWKGEFWDNRETYTTIANAADERPVVFGRYSHASKYAFYTGQPTTCIPTYFYRPSQWNFTNLDDKYQGVPVVVQLADTAVAASVRCENNNVFRYAVVSQFCPVRKVKIEAVSTPTLLGDSLQVRLHLSNPYDFAVTSEQAPLVAIFKLATSHVREPITLSSKSYALAPHDSLEIVTTFPMPTSIRRDNLDGVMFALRNSQHLPTFHGPIYKLSKK